MSYRLFVLMTTGMLALSLCAPANAKLFGRKTGLSYPQAPMPEQPALIPQPQENVYFPMRPDGQPFLLNIDNTVNYTNPINRVYYDPAWRGQSWAPFNCYPLVERGSRLMSTWPGYNNAVDRGHATRVNQWFEKASGFGP